MELVVIFDRILPAGGCRERLNRRDDAALVINPAADGAEGCAEEQDNDQKGPQAPAEAWFFHGASEATDDSSVGELQSIVAVDSGGHNDL